MMKLRAWVLREGDKLADGTEIISIVRDARNYTVAVLTNGGEERTDYLGDEQVLVSVMVSPTVLLVPYYTPSRRRFGRR